MASFVKLGGVELDMPEGSDHSWSLTEGVKPYQKVFLVHKDLAGGILNRGQKQLTEFSGTRVRGKPLPVGPLEMEISHDGGNSVTIHGLYVLQTLPASDPNFVGILVSDFRWLWDRILVERDYNIRRKSGERRLNYAQAGTPIQVVQKTDDITYQVHTMKDLATPYTARDVLEDVLDELTGGNYTISATPLQDPIEGMTLRDQGPAALSRVLAKLPGIALVPNLAGRIEAINTLDLSEVPVAERAAKARIFGRGEWQVVDLSFVRPPEFTVYFEREVEVRFDHDTTSAEASTAERSKGRGREEPVLQNVIAVPDPKITINGKEVVYGTWVLMKDYLEALPNNTDPLTGGAETPPAGLLTDEKIRRHYLAGFSYLHALYSLDKGAGQPNVIWTNRLNAIQEHWRRTFRIPPEWIDKKRSIRAHRVAIIDEENGTRARSDAYFDHTVKPSFRSIAFKGGDKLGWEVTGYAADLSNAKPSPANVQILDEDLGIIQITPKVDPFGVGTVIAPGTLDGPAPSTNAAETIVLWNQVHLEEAWKLALVVTLVPSQPNNEKRLHPVKVTPAEAGKKLPGSPRIGSCRGLPMEIPSGEATARVGWRDAEASQIKQMIWDGDPTPENLLVNPDEIKAVADAHAARVLSVLIDRGMGTFHTSLDGSIKPTGNLRRVTHGLSRRGGEYFAYTRLEMPGVTVPPSIWSLLPETHRARLLKLVQL